MNQPSLFEAQIVGAPHNGTLTSFRAAESIREHIGPMQQRVLDYLAENGPSTQEEISIGAGMRLQSVNGRINELAHKRLITDTGDTRPTSSGRMAVVWSLAVGRGGGGGKEGPVATRGFLAGNQHPATEPASGGGSMEKSNDS